MVKDGKFNEIECSNQWIKLYDEYLSRFGAGKSYDKYMQLNVELINARLDFVVKRDRKILNKVDRIEAKIQNMLLNNGSTYTPHQVLFHLSKFAGQKLSLKETTVSEYFTAIAEYEKHIDEISKNNKKNG